MSKINLLPWREDLKMIKNRIFMAVLAASIALCACFVILIASYYESQIAKQNANIAYINKEMGGIRVEINEFKDLQETRDRILNRMKIIQELRTDRISIVKLFDMLPRVIPDSVYLKKVSRALVKVTPPPPESDADKAKTAVKTPASTKEGAPGSGEVLNTRKRYNVYLEGVAEANESISGLLKSLEKITWLEQIKLNEVSINHDGKGLNFKLSMTQYLSEREGE